MPAATKKTPMARKYAPARKSAAAEQSASAPQNRFPPGSLDRSLSDYRDPLPSADDHAALLQLGGSAPAISNLENAAENTSTNTTQSPTNGNQQISTSQPGPLNDLNNHPQKRRKRALQPDVESGPLPQSFNEMMKKSVLELAKEAQENSKGAMSEEDKQFFLDYHTQQRQMLIIKAIERGVSMPMVDGFLGKRITLKGPNCWNEFFKTKEVQEVFRGKWLPFFPHNPIHH
ncbi:hypothetical protein PTTG_00987 [Puccinia triticina 1-1 BBBD Race 1]|uniref:Uncharacterized protein n=1 Tax=Puccinia triticina (isolate 1-1 / race 1 (BBBD)) TaxID=630390 RepID=A0A0C4EJR6_PUCT1|nr:hypothetical protein PTTG_00987 [Puccinia triticina 1-1 BBBD Race 1]